MQLYETWWFWVLAGTAAMLFGTAGFLLVLRYSRKKGTLPRRLTEMTVHTVSSISQFEGIES